MRQTEEVFYVKVKRSLLVPILNQFRPRQIPIQHVPFVFQQRCRPQSLTMLNGKFINDQALAFANRMHSEGGETVEDPSEIWALACAVS